MDALHTLSRRAGLAALCLALGTLAACGPATPAETTPPPPPCVIPDTGLPTDVFCTGLYANRSSTEYAKDVRPYTPAVVLWSDGAEKHRYLWLPPGTQIDTTDIDAWKFPNGTKAWKEFKFNGKLVETRLEWKRDDGKWYVGTYIWNDAQTEATLNTNPHGTILASGYEIPTLKDCDKCHHGASDNLLGMEAVAMGLEGAQGETLGKLAEEKLLTHPPVTTTLTAPTDATGKAGPAVSYLHVNCGMACHSARGLGEETKLVLRLRATEFWPNGVDQPAVTPDVTQTDIWKATINQDPTTAAVAHHFPGAKRITPGAHDMSLVWLVSHLRGNYQMPPLVSHVIDEEGTARLAAWIDALPKTGG